MISNPSVSSFALLLFFFNTFFRRRLRDDFVISFSFCSIELSFNTLAKITASALAISLVFRAACSSLAAFVSTCGTYLFRCIFRRLDTLPATAGSSDRVTEDDEDDEDEEKVEDEVEEVEEVEEEEEEEEDAEVVEVVEDKDETDALDTDALDTDDADDATTAGCLFFLGKSFKLRDAGCFAVVPGVPLFRFRMISRKLSWVLRLFLRLLPLLTTPPFAASFTSFAATTAVDAVRLFVLLR